jgi:GTPase
MKFKDEVTFGIASGHGGPGAVSFRRESYTPRGGPDGGDGGKGGSIVFRATVHRNTLIDFRFNKTYRADDGGKGDRRDMTGRGGEPLVLLVPIGTLIHRTADIHRTPDEEDAEDELLADLAADGAEWELPGGRGGKGNHFFATPTHRTPDHAQPGEPGVEMRVRLELKLLADVGLLGFPNAGKSTLISRISAARPKVADYPFTTLVPHLGVVDVGEGRSFVVADLPGLFEGAADGAGLGHRFLRHLERCKVLLHLVAADGSDGEEATVEHLLARKRTIDAELQAYDPDLAARPQVVLLSKIDLLSDEAVAELVAGFRAAGLTAVRPISAVSGRGIQDLIHHVWGFLASSLVTED